MDRPSFPVDFATMRRDIEFGVLAPGVRHEVAGMTVTLLRQRHAGDSYGYRFEHAGRTVVYTTDSEHKLSDRNETTALHRLLPRRRPRVFDAMYSLAEAISVKADWGHSSNIVGVELCQLAGVAHLCLFHHEPSSDDAELAAVLADTTRLEEITRRGKPLPVIRRLRRAGNQALTSAAAAAVPAPRRRRIRWIGAALVAALAATLLARPARGWRRLSEAWFDGCQRLFPREVAAMPATVIEIDEKSLAAFGRWPWPRIAAGRSPAAGSVPCALR